MYTRTTRLTARRMAGTASLALAMLALGCSSTVDPKGTVPEPPATVPPPGVRAPGRRRLRVWALKRAVKQVVTRPVPAVTPP